jgi:integrase
MSVKRRKNRKNWSVLWRNSKGEKKQKTFVLKKDAEAFESTIKVQQRNGIEIDLNKGKQHLNKFYDSWIRTKNARPKTINTYKYIWENLIEPEFGYVPVAHIKKPEIKKWVSEAKTKSGSIPSPATLSKAFTVLSMILDCAVDEEAIAINPAKQLKTHSKESVLPKQRSSTKAQPLSLDIVYKISDICGIYKLAILVLALCGFRISELAGLKVKDIDLEKKQITISRALTSLGGKMTLGPTKNGKSRIVPIMPMIIHDLTDHISNLDPEDFVFRSPEGAPLNIDNFSKRVWKSALKNLDLPAFRIHDLRHTCASLYIQNGASVTLVSKLLGHSDVAVTLRIYSHLFPDDMAQMAEEVNNRLLRQQVQAKTKHINIA